MRNHAGVVQWVRAWEYFTGSRSGQRLRDHELESITIDPSIGVVDLPRVGLIPMSFGAYQYACRDGLAARYPRRDNVRHNDHDHQRRPRIHITVANPQLFDPTKSNILQRHDGFMMVDLREVAINMDLRLAATPAHYPTVIAFPKVYDQQEDYPDGIFPLGSWGSTLSVRIA
jgi:hypothetical protein